MDRQIYFETAMVCCARLRFELVLHRLAIRRLLLTNDAVGTVTGTVIQRVYHNIITFHGLVYIRRDQFEALDAEGLVISLLVSSHQNFFHHALSYELTKTSLEGTTIRFRWINKTLQKWNVRTNR